MRTPSLRQREHTPVEPGSLEPYTLVDFNKLTRRAEDTLLVEILARMLESEDALPPSAIISVDKRARYPVLR